MGSETNAPSTIRGTEAEGLKNLTTVLHLCRAGKLGCSAATRRPSAATVRTVAAALDAGDFYPDEAIAAFAWPLLLQAGGLARLDGSRLTLTPRGRRALGQPAHAVIGEIWERWPRHAPIDEFSRVEQIKGQKAAAALSAAGARRQAVVAAVARCPPGEWIGVDDLFGRFRRAEPRLTVARSDRALWKLHLGHPEYGSLGYAGCHDWPILEGRYVLAVLFEYAAPLGVLDVEYGSPAGARDDFRHLWGADDVPALSRYDGLRAVRLTPLGAYAAGLAPAYVPAPPAVPERGLQVLANHDVVALAELSPGDRLVLDAFAVRTAEWVWTISAGSLLAAVHAGRAPGEFAGFLATRAAHGLPATVRTLFDDVETRAGQVRDLGLRRVIECADAQVATPAGAAAIAAGAVHSAGRATPAARPGRRTPGSGRAAQLGYPLGPTTS